MCPPTQVFRPSSTSAAGSRFGPVVCATAEVEKDATTINSKIEIG
jgi:hypothetical protein